MTIDLAELLTQTLDYAPNTFKDQVILVTGAGQGIGYQTARAFAILGGKVIIAEKSSQGLEAERKIKQEGGQAQFIQTDVSDPDSVNHLKNDLFKAFDHVDILVNNAIVIQEYAVIEMPLEVWDQIIAVNLRGTFLMCQAFLPSMLSRKQGTIINMVSTDAMPGLSAYIASKLGITGFTQSLAQELHETGVWTIPFSPGMVDTPGLRSVAEGLAPRLGLTQETFLNLSLHQAYQGLMPPEHAAAAAVILSHDLAEEFHGQQVNGYEILERAGMLESARFDAIKTPKTSPSDQNSQDLQTLLDLLAKMLQETEAEFQQLPIFVRPMAKQGFKRKAGASLRDWQTLAQQMAAGEMTPPAGLDVRLESLAGYYQEVPQETARFTNDEATLQNVVKQTQERLNIIEQLKSALD